MISPGSDGVKSSSSLSNLDSESAPAAASSPPPLTPRAHSGVFESPAATTISSAFTPLYPSACKRARNMTNSAQSPPHVVVVRTLDNNSSTSASTRAPTTASSAARTAPSSASSLSKSFASTTRSTSSSSASSLAEATTRPARAAAVPTNPRARRAPSDSSATGARHGGATRARAVARAMDARATARRRSARMVRERAATSRTGARCRTVTRCEVRESNGRGGGSSVGWTALELHLVEIGAVTELFELARLVQHDVLHVVLVR